MITVADWIVAIGTVAIAMVSFIALFQDKIRDRFKRPKLDVLIYVKPPDCHKIRMIKHIKREGNMKIKLPEISFKTDSYYFRLRVINQGNQKADFVEVFADKLLKQQADGVFKEVQSFLPMNLVWSHTGEVFFPSISPGMYKHCDLAHIINPGEREMWPLENKEWPNVSSEKTILSFDTMVKPNTLSHLIPYGKYRLIIFVSSANSRPVKKILEISLTGSWYDDEQKMFEEGIGIKLIQEA